MMKSVSHDETGLAIQDWIDDALLRDLSCRFIECPSPTGGEADFAELLQVVFADLGLDSRIQIIYDDRFNVVARLHGTGGGPSVMYSGHLDTSVRGDEVWLEGAGWKNVAHIDGERIWGNGIQNMKAAFVCYAAMLDAMRRSGMDTPGDIVVVGTSGEIEVAGIENDTGTRFHGQGVGTRYLVQHGITADYNVLGEPTGMVPNNGHMGSLWARISIPGDYSHSVFAQNRPSAIDTLWQLYGRLEDWIRKYRSNNEFRGVKPQVNRAAIRAGHAWRASRTPKFANLYVDIRFPPASFPIDIQREFEAEIQSFSFARGLSDSISVDWYLSRLGALTENDNPVVWAAEAAHNLVCDREESTVFGPGFCSDAADFTRAGIPTVLYGVGSKSSPTSDPSAADPRSAAGEFVDMDDLRKVTAVYSQIYAHLSRLAIEDVKSRRRPMPGISL